MLLSTALSSPQPQCQCRYYEGLVADCASTNGQYINYKQIDLPHAPSVQLAFRHRSFELDLYLNGLVSVAVSGWTGSSARSKLDLNIVDHDKASLFRSSGLGSDHFKAKGWCDKGGTRQACARQEIRERLLTQITSMTSLQVAEGNKTVL